MTAHSLRIVEGAGAARQSVLNRGATADATLPDAVQRSIVETFGEPLTAAQVVARIIEDVRREGTPP